AIFGTSRHLVVAGTSASAVLVFSAVTALRPKDAASYATLAAGMIVLTGLIIGVVIALLLLVYQASRPRVSMLGADPVVPGTFADIGRHDGITPVRGVLIVRPDAPLFYANAELVRDAIE